jgi:hypothetical protein
MKRNGGILTFLTIMLSSLASAGPVEGLEQLTRGANEAIIIIIQFISDFIFNLESYDELLFSKIIIALIIFFVVYSVLRRNDIFGRDKRITIIITSTVTLLSIRFLPSEFVEVIMLQYNVFAVAVTTLLPLVIFFFFLYQSGFGGFGRRAGWLFYGIALISLATFRGDLGQAIYIYWAGIAIVAIGFIFDKAIITQFNRADINKGRKERYLKVYVHNQKEIGEFQKQLDKEPEDSGLRRKIEKRIEELEKRNKRLDKYL